MAKPAPIRIFRFRFGGLAERRRLSHSISVPRDLAGAKIFVAGHQGMVGAACLRRLAREPCEIITVPRARLDLRRQTEVEAFLGDVRPDIVIIAAARVGGIVANNTMPAEFLYENLAIQANLIHGAHRADIDRLLFLGSSCVYPRDAAQPIREDALLAGALEPTNAWYAVAKIAGVKMCQAYARQYGRQYITAMPCNLYGPGDYFHPDHSHVIPGLLRRFHEAALGGYAAVTCWGSGRARREFMYVDDLADACVFLLRHYSDDRHINVGTGSDVTVHELAHKIAAVTGFSGRIDWDRSKPDGTLQKCLDISTIRNLGWLPSVQLDAGLALLFSWFAQERHRIRD